MVFFLADLELSSNLCGVLRCCWWVVVVSGDFWSLPTHFRLVVGEYGLFLAAGGCYSFLRIRISLLWIGIIVRTNLIVLANCTSRL